MSRFYFTFGSSKQYPYQNGYLEVEASDYHEAVSTYRQKYPDIHEKTINCAFIYNQYEWLNILLDGFYADERPHEILYANPARKREMELFGTLLSVLGDLSYRDEAGTIIICDCEGNEMKDGDGNVMCFYSTVDAVNSLDWLFEEQGTYSVSFKEDNNILEEIV